MTLKKYSIVIPTYNNCDKYLIPCIDSIIENTDLSNIELIISANGCTDNTYEYLTTLRQQYPDLVKIVWDDSPLGYAKATNEGIKVATGDKIILLNNDTLLLSYQKKNEWLELLEQPFLNDPSCGISGPVKLFSDQTKTDFLVFFCVMIDRKVFDRIGLLPEDYGIGAGEDMEFCYLAKKAGFNVIELFSKNYIENIDSWMGIFPIYHIGEGTMHDEELVKDWSLTFLTNTFKLAMKYSWRMNNKMNNDKKIGVITPYYNDLDRLYKVIDTVKSQTLDNVFHYIYDDASNDDCEKIISTLLPDSSIIYIKGEKNIGQASGRNVLIDRALQEGCEFIAFLDSDDYWEPNHLELALKQFNDDNVDIVYSMPKVMDENNNPSWFYNITIPNIFIGKQLLHNNFIWISSVVCRAKCFDELRFDPELNSLEDWDMWISLYKSGFNFMKQEEQTAIYIARSTGQAQFGNVVKSKLEKKHNLLNNLKLHLACGLDYNDDYINIDLYPIGKVDAQFDVLKLPYEDNSVDEIKAFHIIEHFDFREGQKALEEWYRVLKPGGKLYLETPDLLETCRAFVNGDQNFRILLYGHLFAHPWVPGQTHKFLFTEDQLRVQLGWVGFGRIDRVAPASNYVMPHTVHLFLTVEAYKPL